MSGFLPWLFVDGGEVKEGSRFQVPEAVEVVEGGQLTDIPLILVVPVGKQIQPVGVLYSMWWVMSGLDLSSVRSKSGSSMISLNAHLTTA
jgi:hypothetical protein